MWQQQLRWLNPFDCNDILSYVKGIAPATMKEQLLGDGAPDIELSTIGSEPAIERILEPLNECKFPEDGLFELASVLSWLLLQYAGRFDEHDPIKIAYVCTLYMHCYVMDPSNTQDGAAPGALVLLIRSSRRLGLSFSVVALRFCAWCLGNGRDLSDREDAPEFHLTLAIGCLLEMCLRGALLDAQNQLGSLSYYKQRAIGPEAGVHLWAREWHDLLRSDTILGLRLSEDILEDVVRNTGEEGD